MDDHHDASTHDEAEAEMERETGMGLGRRLIQLLLVLNILLLGVSICLPRYAEYRHAQLEVDQSGITSATDSLDGLRAEFGTFYQHTGYRPYIETIYNSLRAAYPDALGDESVLADADRITRDWPGFVNDWAYQCEAPADDEASVARAFATARRALARIEAYRLAGQRDDARPRSARIAEAKLDQLIAFACAMRQIRRAIDNPWVLPNADPATQARWEDDLRAARSELSIYSNDNYWRWRRVANIAGRATNQFDFKAETNLDALAADFSEQLAQARQDRDAARFTVPLIALDMDTLTLQYTLLIAMAFLLAEALIFHRSLFLAPRKGVAHSRYFDVLTKNSTGSRKHGHEAAIEIIRLGILTLLMVGPFTPLIANVLQSFANMDDWLHWGGFIGVDTVFLALIGWAIFTMTRCNLRALVQLETRSNGGTSPATPATPPQPKAPPAPTHAPSGQSNTQSEPADPGQARNSAIGGGS